MTFQPDTNLKAWLFRIARNAFLSGVHRSRRQIAWDPDQHFKLLVQRATQEDALYARDLRAAFARLPSVQKNVLVLIAQDGLSYADAAEVLNVPVGTLRSRVARARASMVAYLAGDLASYYWEPTVCLTQPYTASNTIEKYRLSPAADKTILSRYAQWKISATKVIG